MIKRTINIDNTLYQSLINGDEIIDLEIKRKSANQAEDFNILVNNDLLIRVKKKSKNRLNRNLVNAIVNTKDLVSPASVKRLREIQILDRIIKEKIKQTLQRVYSVDGFDDSYTILQKKWEKLRSIESKLKINLSKKDSIGYCLKCNSFRQSEGLAVNPKDPPVLCPFCRLPVTSKKSYFSLPDSIASYISGFWLEDYVAEKLKALGWLVTKDIYIYGGSGVRFEIDILATKEGKSLIVECKSGNSGLNEISSFMAKFYDIKTNYALFISLPKGASDMKNMVEKNPAFKLIDDIKNDRDLNSKLKKLLL